MPAYGGTPHRTRTTRTINVGAAPPAENSTTSARATNLRTSHRLTAFSYLRARISSTSRTKPLVITRSSIDICKLLASPSRLRGHRSVSTRRFHARIRVSRTEEGDMIGAPVFGQYQERMSTAMGTVHASESRTARCRESETPARTNSGTPGSASASRRTMELDTAKAPC